MSSRVVAICGSPREGSYTRAALHYALDAAEVAGAETEYLDLGDPAVEVPPFDPDRDAETAGDVAQLLASVRAADGVIIGSPVYHGSYSSTFHTFHDWCGFDEYEHTVAGLLCVAGGDAYAGTLNMLRVTVRWVHGWVMPHQVGIPSAYDKFTEREEPTTGIGSEADLVFTDDDIRERTETLGRRIAHYARTGDQFLDPPS